MKKTGFVAVSYLKKGDDGSWSCCGIKNPVYANVCLRCFRNKHWK